MVSDRPYQLEACVVSLAQALQAQARGADRIELCSRLETEGMTPDAELVSSLCVHLNIPVRVMIRATEAGFEADAAVLQAMRDSIQQLKTFPIEGFVFGVIKNSRVDRDAMKFLLQAADPFPVTFHKAIDLSVHLEDDLAWINRLPQIDTLLTSGGATRAKEGISKMLRMKSLFRGQIMGAGKITPKNLPALHDQLRLRWYHGRGIV